MLRKNNVVKTGLAFSIKRVFDQTELGAARIPQTSQKIA
jgi:hypothetical protein